MTEINYFQGDLTDMSAETKTLPCTFSGICLAEISVTSTQTLLMFIHFLKGSLLDQSIQKIFYIIWKTRRTEHVRNTNTTFLLFLTYFLSIPVNSGLFLNACRAYVLEEIMLISCAL